jgi:hypothetical protein
MAKPRGKRIIIRTSLKQDESERINNNWRVLFLDHLAESSNVSESAAKAGISPGRAHKVGARNPNSPACGALRCGRATPILKRPS